MDQAPAFRFGKKPPSVDDTGLNDGPAARRPLHGLYSTSQDTAAVHSGSQAWTPFQSKGAAMGLMPVLKSDLLTPAGACTPVIAPYLKELSSSPASKQSSPVQNNRPRIVADAGGPLKAVRECASSDGTGTDADIPQFKHKSAPAAVPVRPRPGTRTIVKVRVRRALTLQTGSGSLSCLEVQSASRRNVCSKSVGDLNLSGARLQSAARANLSRSADWPASSAACIRKRVGEGTGYEVPRKTSKYEEQSRDLQSAAACLEQMSLQDKKRHVTFGGTTVMSVGQHA